MEASEDALAATTGLPGVEQWVDWLVASERREADSFGGMLMRMDDSLAVTELLVGDLLGLLP